MSQVAIRASGIGKRFRIGSAETSYRTLRDTLAGVATAPMRLARSVGRRSANPGVQADDHMWALADVSFEVKRGEVVGIIGRNGAGKSTLLKTLSRISEPTVGYIDVHGRVGSLLEVGTGFHQELTGRENIYLNGAILGMKRAEIARRFDEIVAFAEVQRFVDTPVKHYSTGMYLRLAFAVAAHLEPEILLVDEVLAVGDAAFQAKCLGKMGEVAHDGRTILFVSHNMGAIRSLCTSGIVLEHGRVLQSGDIASSVETYYRMLTRGGDEQAAAADAAADSAKQARSAFGPIAIDGDRRTSIRQAAPSAIGTELTLARDVSGFHIYCILMDMHGRQIFHLREETASLGLAHIPAGTYRITVTLPPLWLVPGVYALSFKAQIWDAFVQSRIVSDTFPLDVDGSNSMTDAVLHPDARWAVQPKAARA